MGLNVWVKWLLYYTYLKGFCALKPTPIKPLKTTKNGYFSVFLKKLAY